MSDDTGRPGDSGSNAPSDSRPRDAGERREPNPTVADIVSSLHAQAFFERESKKSHETAKRYGTWEVGTAGEAFTRQGARYAAQSQQEWVKRRDIPGEAALRTLCIASGGDLDVSTIQRLCSKAALKTGTILDAILALEVVAAAAIIQATCFDPEVVVAPIGTSAHVAETGRPANPTPDSVNQMQGEPDPPLQPFRGGTLVFFQDRVELCKEVICRGARSVHSRTALQLLARKEHGCFVAYSAEMLAIAVGCKHAAGLIRGLRARIRKRLRAVGLACDDEAVILSGGAGYRFADSISVSVQFGDTPAPPEILAHVATVARVVERVNDLITPTDALVNELVTPPKVRVDELVETFDEPERNVDDHDDDANSDAAEANRRQADLLRLLAQGKRLRVPAIAAALGYSKAMVKRDIAALAGKVRFDGAPKTGGYVLTGTSANHADNRRSRSTAPTSASESRAESR